MTRQEFIDLLMPHALAASQRTGVDPRIIIAQAAQETGWGAHAPGNNYFGIKSHGRAGGQNLATTEFVNGQRVGQTDSFRGYSSPAESVNDYADFLLNNSRYRPMMEAQGLDAQVRALGMSGYATDPNYATSVGSIARGIAIPGGAQPMAYTAPSGGSAGQAAISGATGTGNGLPAVPDAPAGSQRLFRSVSDAREARAAGGTPRLDEISSIIQARRMGDRPLLDRLRNFFQERGTPVLDAIRGDNQPTASTSGGSSGGGSQGDPNIRRIQEQLKAAGFDPGPIDGLMGNRTRTAVRQFQQANGLQVDGDPGPRTQAALAATATPMPLPRDNPARMPQQPNAQARLDYTAPVRPAGLPSMPTGPAPGSMPGMGALPQTGPRGQVPMGNFGTPIAQAPRPAMPTGPSAGSLPGLMPMRDPSRLATPPPGNGMGVSLRTGTGASVNSQPLGQVPGAPDPYDELFQWAASRTASDNARRAMQPSGGVLPSAGSGIIGSPPQGVLGGFSGPRPWGTEAPPMQRFDAPIAPQPQTRMVASTNEQPTSWMDMQQRQSGVMPAARDDLNPYRNAMSLPSYWNAPQMQPGGPGAGGNPVQTTSMPGMTSPPMNGIPPAFWRLFMGTGV